MTKLKLLTAYSILSTGLIICMVTYINDLRARPPELIYQVDNAGGMMIGKVTDKSADDGRYTIEAGVYGKFVADQELYDSVQVGDEVPEELKGREE